MVLMPATLSLRGARHGDVIAFETRNAHGEAVIGRGAISLASR
jgi:hypothetical protein